MGIGYTADSIIIYNIWVNEWNRMIDLNIRGVLHTSSFSNLPDHNDGSDSSSKEEHRMNTDSIRFPAEYEPSRCPVHVVHTIDISAPPAEIWDHLITAADWQTWQPALSNVRIQDGSRKLSQDATFTFKASGVTSAVEVKEFVPNQRIAWSGRAAGLQAYHIWLITPTPNGCRVSSEETLRGIVPRLLKWFAPNLIHNSNQKWLEALAVRSLATTNSVH